MGDGVQQIVQQALHGHIAARCLGAELRDKAMLDFKHQCGRCSHVRWAKRCRHARELTPVEHQGSRPGCSSSLQHAAPADPLGLGGPIATGLVVVGDLIGLGSSQEQAIVGETPNLAARLQGIAQPNSVVIAESTRKLVGNLFELEDLGVQELKGITGIVGA
jgi:class 3 adenylate cyclase